METTKPFEMSDFYKYSTKFNKKSTNGSSESSSSNTSINNAVFPSHNNNNTGDNNNKPPELPAKNSPAKSAPAPPPKKSITSTVSNGDLGETFSSEMLQWYTNKNGQNPQQVPLPRTSKQKSESSSDSDKPATLVWANHKPLSFLKSDSTWHSNLCIFRQPTTLYDSLLWIMFPPKNSSCLAQLSTRNPSVVFISYSLPYSKQEKDKVVTFCIHLFLLFI